MPNNSQRLPDQENPNEGLQQPQLTLDTDQAANLMGAITAGVEGMQQGQAPEGLMGALTAGMTQTPGVAQEAEALSPEQALQAASVGGAAVGTGAMKGVLNGFGAGSK